MTLREVEGVYNWEGYLYRIAHNVYVKYVKEQEKHRAKEAEEGDLIENKDYAAEYAGKEELELLKREVAWLSRRHREIVLLHYFHNKKIAEIANILELPEGTVKWHLSDAKSQLKEGMKQVRTKGNLGIEPIKLTGFGYGGTEGELGTPAQFLSTKLRQNIAYAAYYEPKNMEEIAQELGVSPVYVEDEVDFLTEYGYLDLMPGQRYRTNVFIENLPIDIYAKSKELSREIAKVVCDMYVPELLKEFKEWGADVYVPDNDLNYWYWSKIAMRMMDIGNSFDIDSLKKHNYYVKRKDGGEYVAFAVVDSKEKQSMNTDVDMLSGPMWSVSMDKNIATCSLSTGFDSREFGPLDNKPDDTVAFGLYLKGELPKNEALLDKYVRLYDRGFLVNRAGTDHVNVIVEKTEVFDEKSFSEKIYVSK